MKKQLMALSLVTACGLFAGEEAKLQMQSENNCCENCCCTPCCVPEPKKCIDCECYVPAFYDLQCDWGLFINAEYLYWYAKENRLPFGAVTQSVEALSNGAEFTAVVPLKDVYIGSRWDSGFRVGIGYNSSCDGWDVHLNYTWMCNSKSESENFPPFEGATGVPAVGDSVFASPWILPDGTSWTTFYTTLNRAKWNLRYHVLDLELGKKYWLSRCFNLRPHAGLRGAWTRQNYRVTNISEFDESDLVISIENRFRNKYWGVGFKAGIDPTWYFSSCFALYAQFEGSLLWGEFEGRKEESYQETGSSSETSLAYTACNDFYGMQSIFGLGLGLRYEDTFCCDRYQFTLDLGWEHHLWINHVHRMLVNGTGNQNSFAFTARTFRELDELTTDLGLGGLVVRLRFDF